MKTLKNLLYAIVVLALAASCSNEEVESLGTPHKDVGMQYMEFTASIGANTRTLLTNDNNVEWVAGDEISIFDGSANRKFTTKDNGASAIFGGVAKEAETYYALYPFQEGAIIQGNIIKNVTIPVVQEAKAGSFDGGTNISVASASSDLHLAFKNVGSLVKFSMTNDKAADVRTVKLTSNGGNAVLAGTVNINVGTTPTFTAVSTQSQVTLKSDTGFEKDKDYYLVVLPGTLSEGFSLTFTDKDNKTWQKTYTTEANISRSNILKLNDIELGNFTTGLLTNLNLIAAAEASTGQAFTKNADGTVDLNNSTNRAIVEAVTTLDVDNNNDATIADELFCFPALKVLWCGGNNIESLDLSGNLALEELHCYGIEHFENYVNSEEHGESLGWDGTLKQINITSNTALKVLNVMGNQLTGIDISHNEALTVLWINDNYNLGSLDVSHNPALTSLNAGSDGLSELDVTNNTQLKEMYVSDNYSFSLKGLSNLTLLERLQCNNNGLTSLDVTKNTALVELHCSYQPISELDLSQNTELVTLICNYNNLETLDISHNSKIEEVWANQNPFSYFSGENNPELRILDLNVNNLTSLDVSKNTKLTNLLCQYGHLKEIDVTNNVNLSFFECHGNELTTLDISNNSNITWFRCHENRIRSLDISKNGLFNDRLVVGNQHDENGESINIDLYVNLVQYESDILTDDAEFTDGNTNVNLVLKSDATHEGYNESNYGG